MSRYHWDYRERDCYDAGKRDERYGYSDGGHSRYSDCPCERAYYEGRDDQNRADRERREEEQMMEERQEHEERQRQEELRYQRKAEEAEYYRAMEEAEARRQEENQEEPS